MRADDVEVSILFSDICGFTPKCEKLSARQIVDLLNEYFDLLCPIVKKHHGSVRVESRPGRTTFEVTLPLEGVLAVDPDEAAGRAA